MTPSTEDAHATLRCKINGEDWEPAGGGLFDSSPSDLYFYPSDNRLGLVAGNNESVIDLNCYIDYIGVETPLLYLERIYIDYTNSTDCQIYTLDTASTNFIKINEIDSLDYYLISEFEFAAINECNDTIQVTDGYFDLNYKF